MHNVIRQWFPLGTQQRLQNNWRVTALMHKEFILMANQFHVQDAIKYSETVETPADHSP